MYSAWGVFVTPPQNLCSEFWGDTKTEKNQEFNYQEDSDDESEKADSAAKNLNDENLDEKCRISSVRQSCSGSDLTYAETTDQIDNTSGEAGAKHGIAREPISVDDGVSSRGRGVGLDLTRQDDGNDQSVDGDSLAENDWNQIFRLDSWSFDTAANDGGSSCVNAKSGSNDRQGNCECNSQRSPHVRRGLRQEPANA